MSIINCSKCGNEISGTSEFCSHCGSRITRTAPSGEYSFVANYNPAAKQNNYKNAQDSTVQDKVQKIKCPACGSNHVDITFVQTGASTMTREPGAPTKIGRKAMKASTLGLWGLTGKRTGYSATAFHNRKMALCKDCGHSWAFFSERDKQSANTITIVFLCFLAALLVYILFAII